MTTQKQFVIHAVAVPGSMMWMWVSKEKGMPFTTYIDNARTYKTYASAMIAMEKLRKTHKAWKHVGNACEIYVV